MIVRSVNVKGNKRRRKDSASISAVLGGIAGWSVNFSLSIINNTDTTHLYGISIFLGVIVGLIWDISDKLNRD